MSANKEKKNTNFIFVCYFQPPHTTTAAAVAAYFFNLDNENCRLQNTICFQSNK